MNRKKVGIVLTGGNLDLDRLPLDEPTRVSWVVPAPVLLLDRQSVAELLTLDDCIEAVESAFAAHAQGESLAPGLLHIDGNGGEFHIKVGGIRGERTYFACKVNGGFFGNGSSRNCQTSSGLSYCVTAPRASR